MLHKYLSSPFKLRREEEGSNKASSSSSMAVGLGILVHLSSHLHGNIDKYCSNNNNNNNTILKSADLRLMRVLNQQSPSNAQSCFLKSCFLCSKNLGTDQDIYMYRGDQGFCSEECRNRQIILDDTKELEVSTKKMVAAYRRSCSGMSSETGVLLHDLRRQNKHIPNHKVRAIFS